MGVDTINADFSLDELRRSHELLLKAQRIGRTGYVISDVKTNRLFWSDSLFEQRKVPKREYFTRDEGFAFIHPEDRPLYEAARSKAVESRKPFSIEMRVVCGDGSIIWEKVDSEPQFDEEGNYSGVLAVVHDITESRRDAITLRNQEAAYRTLFDGMGDAITLSKDGTCIDCNAAALEMFRCTREQIIGLPPPIRSPEYQPDGRPSSEKAAEKIKAALAGERQFFEWRHRRFDDTEFDAEVTLNRVDIPGANYFFGIIRDIGERKAAQEALKAAHDQFAGAFDSSVDAMIVATVNDKIGGGIVLDANQSAVRMFGKPREKIIGTSIWELNLFADLSRLEVIRHTLLERGVIRGFQAELTNANGVRFEAELNGSVFYVGDKPHSLVLVRDISERVEAERKIKALNESLNASLKQLRDITDSLPVLISYQDAEGRFEFINKTGEQWLALREGELLGKTVMEVLPEDYINATAALREQRARTSVTFSSEMTLRFPDGKTRCVEGTFIRDTDTSGNVRGTYTITVDTTERRATEEQLHQAQKLQAIGKLTGGVAHDFNNLLAVILGNLELANEKLADRDESVRKLLAPALRSAERGATLTRSLLAFARRQPLEPAVLEVSGLVRDMTNLLRRTVSANIEIELVGGAGTWKCEVDAGQLQNALLNLVVNARDAMPNGGKLTIETGNIRLDDEYARNNAEVTPGQYVMLAVSDTGAGMTPDVLARVFEPFFTTKAMGHGTGLGLSMVYGFAKQSKGHVAIYSEVGHGTTVRIYLPRWSGTTDPATTRAPMQAPVANNETVLVVEDDEDVRFISVTMLRSLGYNVLEAAGGISALDILAGQDAIDLILTDVMLAGSINGRQVADAARNLRPGIKILFMSGYTENAILHHGRLDPGLHFVQKPFRKHDLALKVRQALEDAEPPA